jgi:hypothetical protein
VPQQIRRTRKGKGHPGAFPTTRSVSRLSPVHALVILYRRIDVKELRALGRLYPWDKPARCPACEGIRLWGHGFVLRYFEPFNVPFWVKRCRCPDCGSVHTFRPHPYVRTFRYPLPIILLCLNVKAVTGAWARDLYRQIQQGWWRSLRKAASHDVTITLADMRILVLVLSFWFILCDVLLL